MNDKSKFQVIKGDWFKHIIALEDKLNRNLRKIKKISYQILHIISFLPLGLPLEFFMAHLKFINQAVQLDLFYQPLIPLIII